MEKESPVKRLIQDLPAFKYQSVDQAQNELGQMHHQLYEEEEEQEVHDMVDTLRKSVTEALGKAMTQHS